MPFAQQPQLVKPRHVAWAAPVNCQTAAVAVVERQLHGTRGILYYNVVTHKGEVRHRLNPTQEPIVPPERSRMGSQMGACGFLKV